AERFVGLGQGREFQESLHVRSVRAKSGYERVVEFLLTVREGQFNIAQFCRASLNVLDCLFVHRSQQGKTRLCPRYSKKVNHRFVIIPQAFVVKMLEGTKL